MFDFLKGGKTEVKLTLDRPVSAEGMPVHPYYLGETVHAKLMVTSDKDVKVREGRIALIYHEEYQYRHRHHSTDSHGHTRTSVATAWGTDEREAVRHVFLGESTLPAGTAKGLEFDFPLPATAPPSARAEIIRVEWSIKATLDRPMAGDVESIVVLPVFAGAPGTPVTDLPYRDSSEMQDADMTFSLPKREWVMGETVAGRLQVCPKTPFDVTEIRVELVRREYVPRSEGHEHIATVPVKVSGGTRLEPGQNQTFAFNIPIPAPAPATLKTVNGTLKWSLKGILARRLRKDTFLEEEIFVYNGRAPL